MKSKISQSILIRFVTLTTAARYNEALKKEYRKLGRKILMELVELIEIKKDEFDIRWNPGGIACSGDHILHTDKVYLAFHDNIGSGWFYFRTCKGRKDYTGGPNQIVNWTTLIERGLEPLANTLKVAQNLS